MREEMFKMERKGLVREGQEVTITERVAGSLYSYIVEPAVAMSGSHAVSSPGNLPPSSNSTSLPRVPRRRSGSFFRVIPVIADK